MAALSNAEVREVHTNMIRVFASMRFGDSSPKDLIKMLRDRLLPNGIEVIIYEDQTGNIKKVVEENLDSADVFLACGTKDYGVETSSPISSYKEISYWQEYKSEEGSDKIVRLRMIPFNQHHDPGNARGLFTKDQNQILWLPTQPLTPDIANKVERAIKAAAGVDELVAGVSNISVSTEKRSVEVVILEGEHSWNWVKCRITGPGSKPGTTNIYVLPTSDFDNAVGASDKDIPDVDTNHLRLPCETATGSVIEVVILDGPYKFKWVKCRITGPGSKPGTYNIHVLPTTDYDNAGGASNAEIPDVSTSHLRSLVPP